MADPLDANASISDVPFDENGEPAMWQDAEEDDLLRRATEGIVPARAAEGLAVCPACLESGCEGDCCYDLH